MTTKKLAFLGYGVLLLALILALIMLSRHLRGLGRILRGEEEWKFRGRCRKKPSGTNQGKRLHRGRYRALFCTE